MGCFFDIRDHGRYQMRDPVVDGKLDSFRVDHDEFDFIRRRFVQKAANHGIECDAFPRSGCAGDQKMRHSIEIRHHRVSDNIFSKADGEFGLGLFKCAGNRHLLESNHLSYDIRNLNADDGLAGYRCDNPDARCTEREGKIIRKVYDFIDLNPGGGFIFKCRNDGTRGYGNHTAVHSKIIQLFSSCMDFIRKFSSSAATGLSSGASRKLTEGS